MLTEEQVQKICEFIKEEVSRETSISRDRTDKIIDQEVKPKAAELGKSKKSWAKSLRSEEVS